MYKAVEAGKIGELVCMVRLMKMDVACEIVHMDTTDIVAQTEHGLIRIQVKSSQFKRHGNKNGYQFSLAYGSNKRPLTRGHCDLIAFVAIDRERVLFKPVECLKGQLTKRFLPQKFDRDDVEIKSWNHCMDHLYS
jgi:hypothetical protein